MKGYSIVVSLLVVIAAECAVAQDYYNAAPPPAPSGQYYDPSQLSQLLAPIALYPDPLVAQILAAAGNPSQIAVAASYLNSGGDPNAIDSQPWDPSVQAVAHYPQVLQMMDGNLEWTAQLGQAYQSDPNDVMAAIQQLRQQAMQQGNLQNSPQEQVVNGDGTIEILPANTDMIYVPEYDPGVVYYQPGIPINWGFGFAIGPWLAFDFDWHDHRIIHWDHDHPRPGGWWHDRPVYRRDYMERAPVWHPEEHRGSSRGFYPTVNRGDRGYAPTEVRRPGAPTEVHHPAAPTEVRRPAPTQEVRPVQPQHEAPAHPAPPQRMAPSHPAPQPQPTHTAPQRPTAFSGNENAAAARANSSRGTESRGVSQPSHQSAPAPAPHPAPSSGGGGGGRGGKH